MRIFHICDIANRANGIYSVLKPLSKEQIRLGHQVYVLNVNKSGYNDEFLKLISINDLKSKIDSERPDVVLFHGIFYRAIIPLSNHLIKLNIPYLIELHGSMSLLNIGISKYKKKLAALLFLNKIIINANGIIYLNMQEYCLSAIRQLNSKSIIIPNGVYRNLSPLGHKIGEKIEIIYLGRIHRSHKGIDHLIDALKILQANGHDKDIHVSFYGRIIPEEEKWFKQQINELSSIANYVGPVYGTDKEKAFSESNIFILTSRYEGFPMGILEALSFGCPCIVSPMTNVADVIFTHKCGWVVPLDSQAIAEKILEASSQYRINSKELIDNSISASSYYDWKDIAGKSISEYVKAITNI